MAKIVIIAPTDVDLDDAVKLLKGAGHDVDVEAPSAKTVLHIALGLFGPNAYGFGPEYAVGTADSTATPADTSKDSSDDSTDDKGGDDDKDDSGSGDDAADFSFESVNVDGEVIKAVRVKSPTSTLVVEKLDVGQKTTYTLNESTFSFWPAQVKAPAQRLEISTGKASTSVELLVAQGESTFLKVGDDLAPMFKS